MFELSAVRCRLSRAFCAAVSSLAALVACGDEPAGIESDETAGAEREEPACVERVETWRIAGTITADNLTDQPVTLELWETQHVYCCSDPEATCMAVPGNQLLDRNLTAPGRFDVEIDVPVVTRSRLPSLYLFIRADLDADGWCGPDDAGAEAILTPGSHDGLVIAIEAGCPGYPL